MTFASSATAKKKRSSVKSNQILKDMRIDNIVVDVCC